MRQGLDAAGMPAGDRGHRDLPHTVMFVQAAETVRGTLDPEHVHYGEAALTRRPSGGSGPRTSTGS